MRCLGAPYAGYFLILHRAVGPLGPEQVRWPHHWTGLLGVPGCWGIWVPNGGRPAQRIARTPHPAPPHADLLNFFFFKKTDLRGVTVAGSDTDGGALLHTARRLAVPRTSIADRVLPAYLAPTTVHGA